MLWKPAFFGAKPSLMIKAGMIVAAPMGDPNASIPTPQPVHYRPMFGALGGARHATRMTFLSQAAHEADVHRHLGLESLIGVVRNCRGVQKADMVLNDWQPTIEVDPQTYAGARRWRAADLRAGRGAADGAALLPVLKRRSGMRPCLS